jgi:hypothetical protein
LCAFGGADTRCSKARCIITVDSESSPRSEIKTGGVSGERGEGLPGKRDQEEREQAEHLGRPRIAELLVHDVGRHRGSRFQSEASWQAERASYSLGIEVTRGPRGDVYGLGIGTTARNSTTRIEPW